MNIIELQRIIRRINIGINSAGAVIWALNVQLWWDTPWLATVSAILAVAHVFWAIDAFFTRFEITHSPD